MVSRQNSKYGTLAGLTLLQTCKAVVFFFAVLIFLTSFGPTASGVTNDVSQAGVRSDQFNKAILKMEIPFIKNQGQFQSPDVLFAAASPGTTAWITRAGEIVYSLKGSGRGKNKKRDILYESLVDPSSVEIKGMDQSDTVFNFFFNDNCGRRQVKASAFKSVSFGEVYPGVNLEITASGSTVEKIFKIAPHADPAMIRLSVTGAGPLMVTDKGELKVKTRIGDIHMSRPVAFQEEKGVRKSVDISYLAVGSQYRFKVGEYDRTKPLVIDPYIAGTYFGGSSGNDYVNTMATDAQGNVYIAGETDAYDMPVTDSAPETNLNSTSNDSGFIAKFDPDLTTLLAATYLGGSGYDWITSMAVESETGNIFVTGVTSSSNFPATEGAYDTTYNLGNDIFVAKLDQNIETLISATFLGGRSDDGYYDDGFDDTDDSNGQAAIALGPDGSVFVAGFTGSSDFPSTNGACDTTYNGSFDAFISKFSNDLSELTASSYLGGNQYEWIYSLTLDSSGTLYGVGVTASDNFPVTESAYDTSYNSGWDLFVVCMDSSLGDIQAATFLGGSGKDGYMTDGDKRSIAVTSDNEILIAGSTQSSDFPVGPNAYDASYNGNTDGFLVKMNSSLTDLRQGTFLGGSGSDTIFSLEQDRQYVYVCGWAWQSDDFPVTQNAYDTILGGSVDGYLAVLNADLSNLVYASFIGGTGMDMASHVTVKDSGSVYVAGGTFSDDFPVSASAYDLTANGGGNDAFVSRFDLTPYLSGEDDCRTLITGSNISGAQAANSTITFTVMAANQCSGALYYRFSMHPDYGTQGYDNTQWRSMTDTEWISDNAIDYTFTEAGKYIVVVWVSDSNQDVDDNGVPIIGWSVDIE